MRGRPRGSDPMVACIYWIARSDGGVQAFGNARPLGQWFPNPLCQPIVGMAAVPDGRGYRLAVGDGGIFPFGNAPGLGSAA